MRMPWRFDRRRRRFLQKAGAAAAAAALGPLIITDRTIAQTRTLYVNSWGGSFTAAQEAAYFKPFTALTGIHIRTVTPVSYARIKAQVQAGRYEFDMTSVNSMQWLRASREGLAEPIDWGIFKKGTLPAEAIVANGHGIASNIQGTNLCYRRDKFPNGGPKSWADFWDVQKFPGRRSLCISDPPRTLIFALLADGVPADRLYPLDLDRAFKKLEQIKPQAEFNKRLYYGPINPGAFEFIPHELAVQLPTYSENLAISIREDDEWEADRIAEIEERFTQWLAS